MIVGPRRRDRPGREALSGTRRRILEVIEEVPGAAIQTVADELDLGHSTVRYHVAGLEGDGYIERIRDGRHVRLFVRENDLATRIAPLLRDPARERILDYLSEKPIPHLTINRIATDLGLEFGLVKRTLEQLVEVDVLDLDYIMGRYRIVERRDLETLLERAR